MHNNLPPIYISPVNMPILDAILKSYNKTGMIFSQRQYSSGGGYVDGKVIHKALGSPQVLERDHFCLHEFKKEAIIFDANEFDIIHIDPWYYGEYNADNVRRWMDYFVELNPAIKFEFGTEDFIKNLSIKEYTEAIENVADYHKNITYMVCQGGSVVFDLRNISPIDVEKTKETIKIAKDYGFKVKRHNCDFHTDEEIKVLKSLGVDALNYAPEFTYISNKIVFDAMSPEEKDTIYKEIIEKAPWNRWLDDVSDVTKALLACIHYMDTSDIVKKHINENSELISNSVMERINQIYEL